MSIDNIQQALPGEHVVALSPENATRAVSDWLRRPNLFSGRALTVPTLEQRQRWQAGRVAQRGQAFTPGVVHGMEVSHPVEPDGSDISPLRVFVEAGVGLAVSGEDVLIARRAEFLLSELPVVAPPSVFVGLLDADAQQAADDDAIDNADPRPGAPLPRAIGPTLGQILTQAPDRLPPIGVLVLQPVTIDTADLDANDPCDRCPCDDDTRSGSDPASFEDWRTRDGVRLLWYPWPEEWRPLPFTQLRRRNALAHSIFEAEAVLPHGECLPWEQFGVPIALIAISAEQQIRYIDRAAVVRQGGRAREARLQLANGSVAALAANSRLPALWQARIEQFAEQIVEMGEPLPAPEVLADPFLHLPPCGLLPISALRLDDLDNLRSDFFPPLFTLDAAPVPLEQLDLAIREAAPMAALDIGVPERVRLLVPVTQASWEPRLLLEDEIDKAFEEALERFLLDRARALGARQGLRAKAALLAHALDGQQHLVTDFDKDPLAVEPETLTPWGPPPDGGGHNSSLQAGFHQHFFDGASITFKVEKGDSLFIWVYLDPDNPPRTLMLQWHTAANNWEQRAYFGEDLIGLGTPESPSRRYAGELPVAGAWVRLTVSAAVLELAGAKLDGMAFSLFDGRAAFGETGALTEKEQRNWFSNFIPPDARVQGNERWDLLTHNDLRSPFERDDGVVPSLPETEITGGDLLGGAGQAELAIPKSGFNIYYPLDSGWRGHVISLSGAASPPAFAQKAGSDALSTWVYLDELTPPRAIWGYMFCTGLDAGNNPIGGIALRLAFWGENRLAELNAFVPGIKTYESQTLRAGALPQAGVWTRLALLQPDGEKMEGATQLRVGAIVFMAFGGSMAFSDVSIETAATEEASIPVWPLGEEKGQPTPPFVPYKGSRAELQTALDVLAPTPSSRIGTVRIYTELANDPVLARLSYHELSQLQLRGLQGFADYLRVRIDRADDITDFGFAHMQVDLHRIRQMMMSTTDASRISISPALAAIAKSDSAINVQAQIKDYLTSVKVDPDTKGLGAAAGLGAASGPSVGAAPKNTASGGASRGLSAAQYVAVSAQASLIRVPRAPRNIVYSRPVIGLSEVRTTAIAERLRQPPSTEARDYALANRQRTVSSLLDLLNAFVAEDSGEVPALFQDFDIFGLDDDPFLEAKLVDGKPVRERKLTDFRDNDGLRTLLLQPPPLGSSVDEGSLFTQTAALSDNTVAILRQLEGRLTIYRDALTRCERAQGELQINIDAVSQRLSQVEDALAEARHDVGVARALTAEEQARIAAVNARRRKVLDEEVKFLAYVRPRETSNVLSAPRRVIDPALAEAPLPACLRDHHDVPDELEDMLRVVREAPAGWFMQVPKLLDKLDRSDLLLRAVKSAQQRMPQQIARKLVAMPVSGKLGSAVAHVLARRSAVLTTRLEAVSRVDLDVLARDTWKNLRKQAQDIVSLGDIIDGEHGKGAVAREAADEFNRISAVCSCLHAEFCGVPALIRLDWAETLSQFDDAPNLRNLGSLARWSEIDSTDRRQMQAYVDWLFAQLEPRQVQGEALINDVIRMCLLLASHAPVGRIIVGRLPRPITAVRPGIRIALQSLDQSKLRIGMQAVLYRANYVVARAVVEDVGNGEVSAKVLYTNAAQIDLDVDVRVHFDHASVVSAAPARTGGIFKR